ncbi:ComEA family DNA-binding protein [Actinomyces slackii]
MWIIASLWIAASVVMWITFGGAESNPTLDRLSKGAFGSVLILLVWIVGTIHALFLRRSVLRAVAAREERLRLLVNGSIPSHQGYATITQVQATPPRVCAPGYPQYSTARLVPTSQPGTSASPANFHHFPPQPASSRWAPVQSVQPTPSSAPGSFSAQPSNVSHSHAPHGGFAPIDVNTATRDQLMGLPSLDAAAVDRILRARQDCGGFTDLDHLVVTSSLQPHQLIALTERVSFSPLAPNTSKPPTSTGRLLDL